MAVSCRAVSQAAAGAIWLLADLQALHGGLDDLDFWVFVSLRTAAGALFVAASVTAAIGWKGGGVAGTSSVAWIAIPLAGGLALVGLATVPFSMLIPLVPRTALQLLAGAALAVAYVWRDRARAPRLGPTWLAIGATCLGAAGITGLFGAYLGAVTPTVIGAAGHRRGSPRRDRSPERTRAAGLRVTGGR